MTDDSRSLELAGEGMRCVLVPGGIDVGVDVGDVGVGVGRPAMICGRPCGEPHLWGHPARKVLETVGIDPQ